MADARELLLPVHRRLRAAWKDSCAGWQDDVALDFERRYLEEIEGHGRRFMDDCERFQELLVQAEAALDRLE